MQAEFGTQQVGSNVLAFIIKKQTLEQFATNTDPNLIQRIATETSRDKKKSRDKQTNATVYPIAAKGGKLSDANKVLPTTPKGNMGRFSREAPWSRAQPPSTAFVRGFR
jgi:hypothetical protein